MGEPPDTFEFEDCESENSLMERLGEPTETIDLGGLFTKDVTASGSFDLRGMHRTALGKLLNAIPLPAVLVDRNRTVVFANEACQDLSPGGEDPTGRSFGSLFPRADYALQAETLLNKVIRDRKPLSAEIILGTDSKRIWGRVRVRSLRVGKERYIFVLVEDLTLEKRQLLLTRRHSEELRAARDELEVRVRQRTAELEKINQQLREEIRQRKEAEESTARARDQWERTFDAVPDLVAIVDNHHRVVRMNKAMAERVGLNPGEATGQFCFELFHRSDTPVSLCPHVLLLKDCQERVVELEEENLGGTFLISVTPLYDGRGELMGCVHVARDITERKRLEQQLEYRATRDAVTDLFTRRHFLELLRSSFATACRYDMPLSLGMLDLDRFREINDRYGLLEGDRVLERFGYILKQELRSSDVAGRYGGDEFIVAFPNTPIAGAAGSMERIRDRICRQVFQFDQDSYTVSCTGGLVEVATGVLTVEQLIRASDDALYEAKKQGGNCIAVGDSLTRPK